MPVVRLPAAVVNRGLCAARTPDDGDARPTIGVEPIRPCARHFRLCPAGNDGVRREILGRQL